MTPLLFALAVGAVLTGVVLGVAAIKNRLVVSFDTKAATGIQVTGSLVVGLIIFVAVLSLSQRFILAAGLALTAIVIPRTFISRRHRNTEIQRQLAAAEFAESVQRSLVGGGNIGAAILNAASHAPPELAPELAEYVASQRSGAAVGSRAEALYLLAHRCNEPAMDLVVAQLLAADVDGAGDLSNALAGVADSARSFAEGRARTQTARARTELQAQILGVCVIIVGVLAGVASQDLASVYDASMFGQLFMVPSVALFIIGWWWLDRLNKVASQGRFELRDRKTP